MAKNIYCFLITPLILLTISLKSQSREELNFNQVKAFYSQYDIEERKAIVYDKIHHIISTAGVKFDITKVEVICGDKASTGSVFIKCDNKDCITCADGSSAKKQNGTNCAVARGFQFADREQALKFAGLLNDLKKSVGT